MMPYLQKYLEINLAKDLNNLYSKKSKALKKETELNSRKWKCVQYT